jgi:hypothetical protein
MAYEQGEVIVPVLNINGASPDDLLGAYQAALDALREAITCMNMTAPHGRDFQTEPDSVLAEARDQHRLRVKAVAEVYRDIEGIAVAVQEQKFARATWR